MTLRNKLWFLSWLAVLGLIVSPLKVRACSCGPPGTVLQEFERASFVIVGEVVSVDKAEPGQHYVDDVRSARIIVERVFKGSLRTNDEMIFAQGGGGDCIWTFSEKDIGRRLLLYLSARRDGESFWYARYCGRSKGLEYAADDLSYLENETRVRGKTRLSGVLSFYQPPVFEGQDPIYKGLDGIKVRIVGEKKTYELTTNNVGLYELYDLPAGIYAVEPQIPDGLKIKRPRLQARDKPGAEKPGFYITVEATKHSFLDFIYDNNNAIRGRVLDPSGNPMGGVCLDVVPAQGRASNHLYKSDCTDSRGTFEIDSLPPGRYLIAVNKSGKLSASEPFKTFYYPDVTDPEKAVVLTIVPGQILDGINIVVPQVEATVKVQGVAQYFDGKPVVDGTIRFKPERSIAGVHGDVYSRTDSNGRFSFKILKGHKGSVQGQTMAYRGMYENCPKVEELITKSGNEIAILQTSVAHIQADDDIDNVVLSFPFPMCKRRTSFVNQNPR